MIAALARRVRRAGLEDRIDARVCTEDDLRIGDLQGRVDFVIAFAVVHEVPDPPRMMDQLHTVVRTGGNLLLAEPTGHVSAPAFEASLTLAVHAGFHTLDRPNISGSHAALLTRN